MGGLRISKVVVIGSLFGIVMLGTIIYLSMGFDTYTCEVCVTFKGRTSCRTASGADEKSAMMAAHDNACAFLIGSKTDAFLCGQAPMMQMTCQER
jgi:hypothetical protein